MGGMAQLGRALVRSAGVSGKAQAPIMAVVSTTLDEGNTAEWVPVDEMHFK